jgi:hypothetical protein
MSVPSPFTMAVNRASAGAGGSVYETDECAEGLPVI